MKTKQGGMAHEKERDAEKKEELTTKHAQQRMHNKDPNKQRMHNKDPNFGVAKVLKCKIANFLSCKGLELQQF